MSQENVEALRQGLEAVNRRDKAAWLAACDPDLENIPPSDWPESEPIRGSGLVYDFYVEAQDAWGDESSPYTHVELIDAGRTGSRRKCRPRCEAMRAGQVCPGAIGK